MIGSVNAVAALTDRTSLEREVVDSKGRRSNDHIHSFSQSASAKLPIPFYSCAIKIPKASLLIDFMPCQHNRLFFRDIMCTIAVR